MSLVSVIRLVLTNAVLAWGFVFSLRSSLDPQRARREPWIRSFAHNGKRFRNRSDRFVSRLSLFEAVVFGVLLVAIDLVLLTDWW